MKKFSLIATSFTVLFLAFYGLFLATADTIHSFGKQVDKETLLWWQQGNIHREGIELPVMFVATIVYLLAGYVLSRRFPPPPPSNQRAQSRTFPHGKLIAAFSWAILAIIVLLGMDIPSYYDYGFFIGPALKLGQGEALGSFYMQYGLGLTFLTKLMMDLGFRMQQMQLTFGLLTLLWFFLYYKLASLLIKERVLVWLFMAALVCFRYLSIYFDPIHTPATLPPRLDLWVVPALVLVRFGVFSRVSAVAFALTYLFDNTFGFFVALAYGLLGVIGVIRGIRGIKGVGAVALPLVAAALFNLLFFRSLINPAASIYQDVKLGFLPISHTSLFWLAMFLLPYCIYLLQSERQHHIRRVTFFLFFLLPLQLTYFFGRSHEANLLGVSGVFMLIFFLSLSRLREIGGMRGVSYGVAMLLIVLSPMLFGKYYIDRFQRIVRHVKEGKIVDVHPFDKSIEQNKALFASVYPSTERIVVLSQFDSYINYRMRFRQHGYYVPFSIRLFVDETIDFLTKLIESGHTVVLWENEMVAMVEQLNKRLAQQKSDVRFGLLDKGGFFELTLMKGIQT